MAIGIETIICSLLAGVISWFILPPLIVGIPHRLQLKWRREAEELGGMFSDDLPKITSAMPVIQKGVLSLAVFIIYFVLIQQKGISPETGWLSAYAAALALLCAINLRTSILPDDVVVPTLWLGMFMHASQGQGADQIYGVLAGFVIPFLVYWAFRLLTGREVLGYGDMKALAMAGAWFGYSAIPTLLLVFVAASLASVVVLTTFNARNFSYIPTGPAHLFASLSVMFGLHFNIP